MVDVGQCCAWHERVPFFSDINYNNLSICLEYKWLVQHFHYLNKTYLGTILCPTSHHISLNAAGSYHRETIFDHSLRHGTSHRKSTACEEEVVMDSSKELWNGWTNYWWYSCVCHMILLTGKTGHKRVGNEGKAISGEEYDLKEIGKEIGQMKGRGGGEMHPIEIHQPDIHRQWHMQKRRRRRLLPSRRS